MTEHNHGPHADDFDAVCPACLEERAAETRASIEAWLRRLHDETWNPMYQTLADDVHDGKDLQPATEGP